MLACLRHSLSVILLLYANSGFALGSLGHQLVCQLSYDQFSTALRQQVDLLLAQLPKSEQQRINHFLHRPTAAPVTFADSCVWADAIKKDHNYDKFKTWHYLNVAREVTQIDSNTCTSNCVVAAIISHRQQLATAQAAWQKVQALMLLGHWLGDIHQPMHVSFADDLGGNKVAVATTDEHCTNLHWLWDECLLTRSGQSNLQLMHTLTTLWQTAPINLWQQSAPWQWANESLLLVRSAGLGYCRLQQNNCVANETALINAQYQQRMLPILLQRMVQASARLVTLLEQALN
jgi:hypothetical protein